MKKKLLFVITKSNRGTAFLETLGIPALAPLAAFLHGDPAGSPTPSSAPPQQ